jgi:Alpha-amylase/4-alpha-glucanotransferase, C-terminal
LSVRYAWDPGVAADEVFSTELSVAGQLAIEAPGGDIWRHPIETVAKSERGLDRTRQGDSLTVRWPARLGQASLELRPT